MKKNNLQLPKWTNGQFHSLANIEEDLLLFDTPDILPKENNPIKLTNPMAILCSQGQLTIHVNFKPYEVTSPAQFVAITGQTLQCSSVSTDFEGLFLIMSKKFLSDLLSGPRERIPLFMSVMNHPLTPLTSRELGAISIYFSLLKKEMGKPENPYRLETTRHLVQALFYSTGYQMHPVRQQPHQAKNEILMEKFIELVKAHFKKERTIGFYAQKLQLTPKYLSRLIKENSHKTANEWINDYVMLEAKALLQSTHLTIQQISDQLNFPSQSVFGKYFKYQQGVSPREFRNPGE